jgi:hypothetical protein
LGKSLLGSSQDLRTDELGAKHDDNLYSDFEKFAKAMREKEPNLSESDLKDFLADEKALETNDLAARLRSLPAQR